ncbi:hypothetical protein QQF64_007515 [Cirrhinus molitorella]|uniref:SPRY-associated domain-containing protein n=1 Tax=Cirrhinus molitorella TaxID=172907 RepID=A0ABR3MAX1_9TELE
MDEHKNHDTVSAGAQRTEKQKQLKETQKTFQQRIQQREKDVQQLREAVESHKRSAQTAVEDSERMFELIRLIRDQEKAAVSRAEGRLERLEQEINDLRRRDAELEQLSHTQDHIQFLQSFQSLSAPPESTDVNDDLFSSLVSFDGLRESVHQLRDKLEDFCKEELKKISDTVTFTNIVPGTTNDFLQYSHQLTLDLNTVNKRLRLSENNRVITNTGTDQPYPRHPDRFDDKCQNIMMKLPYRLREKWRTIACEFQERNGCRLKFTDMVDFIEHQVKILTDPLFVDIKDTQAPLSHQAKVKSVPYSAKSKTIEEKQVNNALVTLQTYAHIGAGEQDCSLSIVPVQNPESQHKHTHTARRGLLKFPRIHHVDLGKTSSCFQNRCSQELLSEHVQFDRGDTLDK